MTAPSLTNIPDGGTYISFPTSKLFGFLRRGRGQVLAVDRENRTVHIRVKAPFHIGHLAISASAFAGSDVQTVGSGTVPQDAWQAIANWRTEFANGKAGAFTVPIYKAIEFTTKTVVGRHQPGEADLVESAYPEKSPKGDLNTIKAIYSTKKSRSQT